MTRATVRLLFVMCLPSFPRFVEHLVFFWRGQLHVADPSLFVTIQSCTRGILRRGARQSPTLYSSTRHSLTLQRTRACAQELVRSEAAAPCPPPQGRSPPSAARGLRQASRQAAQGRTIQRPSCPCGARSVWIIGGPLKLKNSAKLLLLWSASHQAAPGCFPKPGALLRRGARQSPTMLLWPFPGIFAGSFQTPFRLFWG